MKEKKYAMIIDSLKCFDCKACLVACKVENDLPDRLWRNWIKDNSVLKGRRTQYQPGQCMQCDEPSCVAACPVGATFKGKDGLVEIDPEKCVCCGNCVTACPYGARFLDPRKRVADKCDFCQHRLLRGEEPACVETCPTKVRTFGDLNNPDSEISRQMRQQKLVTVINPLIDTKPNIFYSKETCLLYWPEEPTLPGDIHMSSEFWKKSG